MKLWVLIHDPGWEGSSVYVRGVYSTKQQAEAVAVAYSDSPHPTFRHSLDDVTGCCGATAFEVDALPTTFGAPEQDVTA